MHHLPRSLLLCLLAASAACAAAPPRPQPLKRPELLAELKKLVVAPALRQARIGVAVHDLADRQWLFEHNADQLLIVASNNKLATTAAALELLGADFEFSTTLAAVGRISADGVLDGDLLVKGRGDPSLSGRFHDGKATAVIDQWAKAVADAGIKSVRGAVLADDFYFDRQGTHPHWPAAQRSAWYCAPTGALSFNDNCILVVVTPTRRGKPAAVATIPPTAYVTLSNQCTTSRARVGDDRIVVHRRDGGNVITVSGHIPEKHAPYRTWITIEGPALYTATVFREALAARKIPVSGLVRLRTLGDRFEPESCRELVTTTSALKDALAVANSNSQNFYAEQILKTLGREKGGQGSWPVGARVVSEFLTKTAGVTAGFQYHDGSGLGRANRFSARQLAQLLAYMNTRRDGNVYMHSLAEPGEPGTLARRLDPLRERVFAKTGYIAGVSALSGYVETRANRLLAFSILVNDYRCTLADVRRVQDAICLFLGDYAP